VRHRGHPRSCRDVTRNIGASSHADVSAADITAHVGLSRRRDEQRCRPTAMAANNAAENFFMSYVLTAST